MSLNHVLLSCFEFKFLASAFLKVALNQTKFPVSCACVCVCVCVCIQRKLHCMDKTKLFENKVEWFLVLHSPESLRDLIVLEVFQLISM